MIEEKSLDVTFFEIVTMMALLEFRERAVDYAVLECGLGGRLDATNVVEGDHVACTAITSIGRDHEGTRRTTWLRYCPGNVRLRTPGTFLSRSRAGKGRRRTPRNCHRHNG